MWEVVLTSPRGAVFAKEQWEEGEFLRKITFGWTSEGHQLVPGPRQQRGVSRSL